MKIWVESNSYQLLNLELLKLDEFRAARLEVQFSRRAIRGALGRRATLQGHERSGRPTRDLLVSLCTACVTSVRRHFKVRLHGGLTRNEAAHSDEMPDLGRFHIAHR